MEKPQTVVDFFESLFPSALALPDDPTGLHVVSTQRSVRKILGALELNPRVLQSVQQTGADFLYLHHPPIWEPLPRLDRHDPWTALLCDLYRMDVTVLAHHTNLDCAPLGMAQQWIDGLALRGPVRPIQPGIQHHSFTMVTFVPPEAVDLVRQSAFQAGAGVIGRYHECSFYVPGTGTFTPQPGASPYRGQEHLPSQTAEVRLEMAVPAACLEQVTMAVRHAHPYQEAVINAYPVHPSESGSTGLGRLVTLEHSIEFTELYERTQNLFSQSCQMVKPYRDCSTLLSCIALCPGSGGSLLPQVIRHSAPVYLTGDLSHHQLEKLRLHGLYVIQIPHDMGERYAFKSIFTIIREQAYRKRFSVEFLFEDEL